MTSKRRRLAREQVRRRYLNGNVVAGSIESDGGSGKEIDIGGENFTGSGLGSGDGDKAGA